MIRPNSPQRYPPLFLPDSSVCSLFRINRGLYGKLQKNAYNSNISISYFGKFSRFERPIFPWMNYFFICASGCCQKRREISVSGSALQGHIAAAKPPPVSWEAVAIFFPIHTRGTMLCTVNCRTIFRPVFHIFINPQQPISDISRKPIDL